MPLMLATEPFDATAVATRPGTPQLPPSAQAREPGGLEMALASRPPIGMYGRGVPPVPIRQNLTSCAAADEAASAPANAMAAPRLMSDESDMDYLANE